MGGGGVGVQRDRMLDFCEGGASTWDARSVAFSVSESTSRADSLECGRGGFAVDLVWVAKGLGLVVGHDVLQN